MSTPRFRDEIAGWWNPQTSSIWNSSRPWTDANGDFEPQLNELGPLSNAGFGGNRVLRQVDEKLREGWGLRPYSWDISAGVQQEILPNVSVTANYLRHWYGNMLGLDNRLVNPADYNEYCITAPSDARLGAVSGQQVCGLFDITPSKFGQYDYLIKSADDYGKMTDRWHGMDLGVNGTVRERLFVGGGLSSGKTTLDNCDVAGKLDNIGTFGTDPAVVGAISQGLPITGAGYHETTQVSPSPSLRFCHQETPFLTTVKLHGTYRLPWEMSMSAIWQNAAGSPIRSQYVATNAEIAPSLGRNLAGGANVATLELIAPHTQYTDRINQLDLRLAKTVQVGRARVQGIVDLYNATNASPVLSVNTRYGPTWRRPLSALDGRLVKLGVQVDF